MTSTTLRAGLRQRLIQKLAEKQTRGKASSDSQGFTLIELLVVVVILGVLSAVGVPAYLNQADKARENASEAAAMAAAKACAASKIAGTTFTIGDGATGTCTTLPAAFTGNVGNLTKEGIATVAADGSITMTQQAAK